MAVQVRHRLGDGVVHRDEGALRTQPVDHRLSQALLRRQEAVTQTRRQVGQRQDVHPRHQQHVALEQRTDIEEGNEVVVGPHERRLDIAGHDRAEGAGRGSHVPDATDTPNGGIAPFRGPSGR
jgi:hypothetical protein